MAKNISLVRPRVVTGDGVGLVSHAGVGWLGETADLSGLTAGLTAAMAGIAQRRHDPGRTLAQMVLAVADGATCLSDIAALRSQPAMFGAVPSDATVWRTFDQIGPVELRGIATARADARARAWAAGAGPAGDSLIIDIDATLLVTRSNKQDAAPTYKRTFGHHPLLAMIAETDEVLTGLMRPGSAGSNTAIDHVSVLGDAVAQLPAQWQAGHQHSDDTALVQHPILVRADSAGATHIPPVPRVIGRSVQVRVNHRCEPRHAGEAQGVDNIGGRHWWVPAGGGHLHDHLEQIARVCNVEVDEKVVRLLSR